MRNPRGTAQIEFHSQSPSCFLKLVDSSCELAIYISSSPCGKILSFQRTYFLHTIRVYSGERRKKGVVLGGDVPLGRAPGQSPKSQVMLYMNIEVITSIRLWVRCPSHPYPVLLPGCLIRLKIASLGHAAGILWMAKPIRQICCSYL